MPTERIKLPISIAVENPVPGLAVLLQRGKGEKVMLLPPTRSSSAATVFDLEIAFDGRLPDGRPRLLGECVQGPPGARFVYLMVGKYAGQTGSQWAGRVKVPLGGIGWDQIGALSHGARLTARIEGRSSRGGPALASVKLLPPGWT